MIFDIAEMDNVNSVGKICCTNLTGLLSPDLLHVCVSDMISCKYISHFQVVHVHVLLFIFAFCTIAIFTAFHSVARTFDTCFFDKYSNIQNVNLL